MSPRAWHLFALVSFAQTSAPYDPRHHHVTPTLPAAFVCPAHESQTRSPNAYTTLRIAYARPLFLRPPTMYHPSHRNRSVLTMVLKQVPHVLARARFLSFLLRDEATRG
ncbi:hypothetical protein BV25DRAFT_1043515 [Artomyces pyxidatus]|uniref:Uncharacterized protein n=1 Tax=Artomyces pyxidatus TaxID=48021 RepID=A0ACB8STD8_9AGAM|nr:hypothetical protein BV25DRAFT_1043515 [Artomyces pyxidatus]